MTITRLEELSLNAWPALHTLHADGWVLRLSAGYSRRANSVQALYPGTRPLREKIEAAEAVYRAQGLPAIFKLTPAAQPPELDEALAARGYQRAAPTSVQTLDLRGRALDGSGAAALSDTLSEDWAIAYCALSGVDARHHATLRRMLASLVPARGFSMLASRSDPPTPIACGLAVLEAGHAGLFDIVTHPDHRRQGHARRLIADALAWAQRQGAHTAYLQVMLNNLAALRLYEALGFVERYQYWYRVRE